MTAPRSLLLRSVLDCLRDHPHDDTAAEVARRLGRVSRDDVQAALQALECDDLVIHAGEHWQLSRQGRRVAGPALGNE
jgi:hypothetical protein